MEIDDKYFAHNYYPIEDDLVAQKLLGN